MEISQENMEDKGKPEKPAKETAFNSRHSTAEFLLRRMRRSENFPSISKYITEINQKLSSIEKYTSTSDLSNVVLKDYALTTKLLKLVNSAFHGTMTKPINTVSRAIVLLGFEQVRMAATSIILFEHLRGKSNMKELQDSAVSSFTSAVLAKKLGEDFSIDPEEAFVCAMFQNMGKNLVMFHLPDEYKQIKLAMTRKGIDEQAASQIVLGRTLNDLGIEIAGAWKFSEKIKNGIKLLPDGEVGRAKSDNNILQGISNYANEICTIISHVGEEERANALEASRKRFNKCVPVSKKQFGELLDSSRNEIEKHLEALDINKTNSHFINCLTSELQTRNKKDTVDDTKPVVVTKNHGIGAGRGTTPEEKDVSPAVRREDELRIILTDGIVEITQALVENFKLNDLILMIVETMFRGFCFQSVLFCMVEPKRKRVQARFGLGRDVDTLVRDFGFRLKTSSDLFNVAVSQARDFRIDDSNDPAIKAQIPEWYRKTVSAPSFIIYPIFIDKVCLGFFYADKENKGPPIPENQLNYMDILRNNLVIAIKQSRA